MRCSSCSALALLFAACAPTNTVSYVPAPDIERLSQDDMQDQAEKLLKAECPRVLGARESTTGVAQMTLVFAGNGNALRAEMHERSGDARIDAIFGQLAVKLHLELFQLPSRSQNGVIQSHLSMGYSCAPGTSVVTVAFRPVQ